MRIAPRFRTRRPPPPSRRDALRQALSLAGLAALAPLARGLPLGPAAPAPGRRFVVVVDLVGGCDSLNLLVPAQLATYAARRPHLALPLENPLPLTGGPHGTAVHRLHPRLPRLRALWDEGSVAFVRKVGYPSMNRSHFTSRDIHAQAVRHGFDALQLPPSGWIARLADHEQLRTPTGVVSVGADRPLALQGGQLRPLQVADLASFRFERDEAGGELHDHGLAAVQDVLRATAPDGPAGGVAETLLQARTLTEQVQQAVADYEAALPPELASGDLAYGDTDFSRKMRDIATLVHAGLDTRLFHSALPGFDSHSEQGVLTGGVQPTLLAELDEGLGAFVRDMKRMGTWEDTVLVLLSEFGRRNDENASLGTDHGGAYTALVLGGAVRGGLHGPDLLESDLAQDVVDYEVDFRDILREVLERHLGVDPGPVFPEPQPSHTVLGLV